MSGVMVLCRGRSVLYGTGRQVESVAQVQLPILCRNARGEEDGRELGK
jgi:hypothetical protein